MQIFSQDFSDMKDLPKDCTCDGRGRLPVFEIKDQPNETKSFVLTCNDSDAPSGNFVHLILLNIPHDTTLIDDLGKITGDFLPNSSGGLGYYPPCPPAGSHRYVFTLYALGVEKVDPASITSLENDIKPHILASDTITGIYNRG